MECLLKRILCCCIPSEQNGIADSYNVPTVSTKYDNTSRKDSCVKSKRELVCANFDEMNLNRKLLQGIYACGYENPSYIQQRAIIPCISGRNVIVYAKSGTGKTITSCIAILQRINPTNRFCQALILTRTRELALKIQEYIFRLSDLMNVTCHACIGGTNIQDDLRVLRNGVQIVVGTPGRVCHVVTRQFFRRNPINMFVLDEADEIFQGSKQQVDKVIQCMNTDTQIILLSATMPSDLLEMTPKFMRDPVRILNEQVDEVIIVFRELNINVKREERKLEMFLDLYDMFEMEMIGAIVFCNTRKKVDWLAKLMRRKQHTVSALHGGMDINLRKTTMNRICSGKTKVLIITDMLVPDNTVQESIYWIVNYDLPANMEIYIRRIDIGNRFGGPKSAINFVTSDDSAFGSLESTLKCFTQ